MSTRPPPFCFDDGQVMSLNDQVAISLRRLSCVDSMTNVANLFGTNAATISKVTWRFVDALAAVGLRHLQWPPEMTRVKSGFERIGGLPNCCGAIETTHLTMFPDSVELESQAWLDRQNNHSVLLQAVVEPEMRFTDMTAGWPGHMTETAVLAQSGFFRRTQTGTTLSGNPIELADGMKIREYLVAGPGFPLLPWLITPYPDEEVLSEDRFEFNKAHLEARLVAKRALKKLKDVWAVVDGGLWRLGTDSLPRIVLACCILHNIVIDMEGDGGSDVSMMSIEHDPGYLPEKSKFAHKDAEVMRDKLVSYLARPDPTIQ